MCVLGDPQISLEGALCIESRKPRIAEGYKFLTESIHSTAKQSKAQDRQSTDEKVW